MSSKVAEKLIQAAIASFAESGFHGSTTKDVCDRADCTEGSLFRLYGSKEKLFEAAVRAAFDRGRMPNDELARILENDQNFERGLRKAMIEFFDRVSDQYLRLVTFSILERPALVHEHLMGSSFARIVAHTIEREVYRGNLRDDIPSDTAAAALVASLWHLAFASRFVAPGTKSMESRRGAVRNAVEIWFHGMRKTPSKSPKKTD